MLSVNSYQNSQMVNFGAIKNPMRNRAFQKQLLNEAVETVKVGTRNGKGIEQAFDTRFYSIRRVAGLPSKTKTSKRVRVID